MDKKEIAAVWQAYLEVQEGKSKKKEALDPVGKEDGDVDNDGDKDSSDEYLANRRKKISKAMGKDDKKDDVKEGELPPALKKAAEKKKKDAKDVDDKEDDKEEMDESSCNSKTRKEEEGEECPECGGKGCDHCDGKGYHKAKKETYGKKMKESNLFSEDELAALEEKMKQPNDTGTPAEPFMSTNSAGEKKFAGDHKKSEAKFEVMQKKGTEDASKAGKVGKQSPARRGDNLSNGDSKTPEKV